MMPIVLRALCLFSLLWMPTALADAPRQIQWSDLAPKSREADNPFLRLTRDQLAQLAEVASVRDRKDKGDKSLAAADLAAEQASVRKLRQAGLDPDALLEKRREMRLHSKGAGAAINPLLDGQHVRLPGYLLPLDMAGRKVTEFLLVPWVGACIHTPPPPPNQIVHVRPDVPYEVNGMFEPVWVTGKLSGSAVRKSLYMVDGTSDIEIGYAITATRVEAYKP